MNGKTKYPGKLVRDLLQVDQASGKPVVYTLFAEDGRILYIGCTISLASRLMSHRPKPWWPDVVEVRWVRYKNRRKALAAEAAAIRLHGPKFNISYNDGVGKSV